MGQDKQQNIYSVTINLCPSDSLKRFINTAANFNLGVYNKLELAKTELIKEVMVYSDSEVFGESI